MHTEGRAFNRMRLASFLLYAFLVLTLVVFSPSCSSRNHEKGEGTIEDWIRNTREGNYKVVARDQGTELGVGLYDNGSYRTIPASRAMLAIYNRASEDRFIVNMKDMTYMAAGKEEQDAFSYFLPSSFLDVYFKMPSYWSGDTFEQRTVDNRIFTIEMKGPDHLPSSFKVSKEGQVFRELSWEYLDVGGIGQRNFELPEGVTFKSE